jgi:hypothetical protein
MFDGVGNLILKFRDLADRKGKGALTADEEREWGEVKKELTRALRDSAAPGGRRSPRISSAIGVSLTADGAGGAVQKGEAVSLNAHGFGLNLAQPPAVGTAVSVMLERSELVGAMLKLRGKVVSVRGNLTGIEFLDLTDADRELITVVMLEEYLG